MENSLDRLLDGMAQILVEHLAPAAEDPWVRSQALAAAELLANLAPRVTWRRDVALAWVGDLRAVVRDGVADPAAGQAFTGAAGVLNLSAPEDAPEPPAELEAYLSAHLEALADAAGWAAKCGEDDPLAVRVRAVVDAQAAQERALVRRQPRPRQAA